MVVVVFSLLLFFGGGSGCCVGSTYEHNGFAANGFSFPVDGAMSVDGHSRGT